jgi:hypothetical protein
MKRSIKLAGMLFALLTSVAAVPAANAQTPLLTNGTGSLEPWVTSDLWFDAGGGSVYSDQPLANVQVGANPVTIGGFGVFGRFDGPVTTGSRVEWVLFADGVFNGTYSFQQTATSNTAGWFNSLGATLTLAANTTYQFGLVANDAFSWGMFAGNASPIEANGLTLLDAMPQATVNLSGGPGSGFDGIVAWDVYTGLPGYQPSLQIFGEDYAQLPAIPEPSEWAMLVAGLMVIGFVANRRRKVTTI